MKKFPHWYKKSKKRKFLKKFEGRKESKKLNYIGKNILKANNISHINISFYVLKSNVINAFATENNEVYITEGILKFFAYEEKFIAAVLSHEIAHIIKGHIKKNQKFISKITILSSILPTITIGILFFTYLFAFNNTWSPFVGIILAARNRIYSSLLIL